MLNNSTQLHLNRYSLELCEYFDEIQYIFVLRLLSSSFYLFILAESQPSQIGCLPYFHTWCGLSANLRRRSETCCTRLAENTRRKNSQKSPSGHHRTNLSGYNFATKARIDNRKKIVKQQYVLQISHNMVNFGPLAAEIVSLLCGTPASFNWFHVLAALLHGM